MARLQKDGEDLVGKVCCSGLGRAGLVVGRKSITFKNGDTGVFWHGIGFDGKGLWASNSQEPVIVLADSVADYCDMVFQRPSNVSYGVIAVRPPE